MSVGTNPAYAATLEASGGLPLISSDGVFLGVFVRGSTPVVRARFDNVVIRATAP